MVVQTETLSEYLICEGVPTIDLSKPATYTIGDRVVEVFDTVEDHEKKLKECFDFDQIRKLFARDDFSMCYDSMCGVQSPYAKRIIFRLSGTGVAGATVRMYLEKYEPKDGNLEQGAFDVVRPLADIALKLSDLKNFTGREAPSVIT